VVTVPREWERSIDRAKQAGKSAEKARKQIDEKKK
jgi:hypothetical protein